MTRSNRLRLSRKVLDHFARPILIHVCKDGTLTYRHRNEPVFNGVALPVFSVDTEAQAEAILVRFGRRQYGEHPQMRGKAWFRLSRLGDGIDPATRSDGVLELDDLLGVTEMFSTFFKAYLLGRESLPFARVTLHDVKGGGRQGELAVPFSRLVTIFGEPEQTQNRKTAFEWPLKFTDGTVASIYDYRAPSRGNPTYPTPEQMRAEDFAHWHVGGHGPRAFELVLAAIAASDEQGVAQ